MAAELVLRPVINQTVEIAANLIGEAASRLYWLKADIEWLQRQLNLMQSYLKNARAKEAGDERVKTLINQIGELALDVDDLLDTYLPQLQSHKSVFRLPNKLYKKHQFAMEIGKIKIRVQEIDQARKTFGITETEVNRQENIYGAWNSRRSILYADDPQTIGRDKSAKELEAKLLDPRVNYGVVSIVGMAGLGKTTLAKRIYNSVKDRFDCSAMVYVSQKPQVKELLQSIARQVGVREELKLEHLQRELLSVLKEKKYVILLDDIWAIDAWDDLKVIFPTHPKIGSRLIVTSRNDSVCRYIGGESSLCKLEPLSSKDSVTLFWKSVKTHEGNINYFLPDLQHIGEKIAEKCGGVPLAIVLTAGILRARGTNERQWSLILKTMGHNKEDEWSKILALSSNDLPSRLKPCFLYLGLFPEDYEIPATCLINMWAAEKFILANGTQEVEEVGEEYLYDLAARNLVQVVKRGFDGRIKSCRIHDLLHNLCVGEAEEKNFFQTLDNLKRLDLNSVIKVRRLTTHRSSLDDYIALNPQMPKVRAFLCFSQSRKQTKQLRRMIFGEHRFLGLLRVVLPSPYFEYSLKEIQKMKQLCYLKVNGVPADSLYFEKLENLQSIHTGAFIPFDNVWKLKQLRHLQTVMGNFSPSIVASLSNLQTLNIKNLTWHPEMLLFLNKLSSLRRLSVRLSDVGPITEALSRATPVMPKIEILKFASSTSRCKTVNLSRFLNLVSLHLGVILYKLPNHDEFPPNLNKLTLRHSRLRKDPMETLGRLPKLKILKLCAGSYYGRSLNCSGINSFPNLRVLVLNALYNLEEVMVDDGVVQQLQTVVIQRCYRLKRISERLKNIRKNAYLKGNIWAEMKMRTRCS